MARNVRNVGASVRARLLDLAQARGLDFQLVAIRYVLERLLYRLSVSPYRERFVLKGAMLFQIWLGDPARPTRDLDFLAFGERDIETMERIFVEVCTIPVPDDGVVVDVEGLRAEPIRGDTEYGGVRVHTEASLAGARLPIRIDVGFGDAVTPDAMDVEYPVLLDAPAPKIRIYPRETVVAEKFQAIVALGVANSRMKDFYDLWAMSETHEFDGRLLASAIFATFERRRTEVPQEIPAGLADEVAQSPEKRGQWMGFIRREPLAMPAKELVDVVAVLRTFLMPIASAIRNETDVAGSWNPGGPWTLGEH